MKVFFRRDLLLTDPALAGMLVGRATNADLACLRHRSSGNQQWILDEPVLGHERAHFLIGHEDEVRWTMLRWLGHQARNSAVELLSVHADEWWNGTEIEPMMFGPDRAMEGRSFLQHHNPALDEGRIPLEKAAHLGIDCYFPAVP